MLVDIAVICAIFLVSNVFNYMTRCVYNWGHNIALALYNRASLRLPTPAAHQAAPDERLHQVMSVTVTNSTSSGRYSTVRKRTTTVRFRHDSNQHLEAGGQKFAPQNRMENSYNMF